jgi:hypothetical protein
MNENLTAARGRISMPTLPRKLPAEPCSDPAASGTAMVAQANQLPQQVLSLLK